MSVKYQESQSLLVVHTYIQGPAEIPDDFATQLTVESLGVGNMSLSALLVRRKAFQLPWSAGL
jgi:hypothetical protein